MNEIKAAETMKSNAVLVAGSGIGGMQSAILLAEAGHKVYLLDPAPGIGGSLHLLDNTFPTDSCGLCMMLPGRAAYCPSLECDMHANIELLPLSEVTSLTGELGAFSVEIEQRPRFVDVDLCNNCGLCVEVCPENRSDDLELDLAPRKAIYSPPSRAVPNAYVIDPEACSRCGQCVEACPAGAIDLDMPVRHSQIEVGAVILSPGFKPFDARLKNEYGFGYYPNVLTSLQYERMSSFAGSTGGKIRRPSDGRRPDRVAFISCVGSRDPSIGRNYCSSVCCMYSAKLTRVSKRVEPDMAVTVFYMDTRAVGKGYERYLTEAQALDKVRYVRSMPGHVREIPGSGNLRVQYAAFDPAGAPSIVEEEFDMVVLAVGFDPADGTLALAERLGVDLNDYCYSSPPVFEPGRTNRPGIFVAGSFGEPKDIPETVVEAAAAASLAAALLNEEPPVVPAVEPAPAERDVEDEEIRLGVFVSAENGDLGDRLDPAELAAYAGRLPDVVHTGELSSFTAAAREPIQAAIKAHNLNRVVVAAGDHRRQLPLLQQIARESGLNANFVEIANIREQVAWSAENGRAAAGARDALRMAIARVRNAKAIQHQAVGLEHAALVIGGGVAGMTAALALGDQGIEVVLLEQSDHLGGNLTEIWTGFYGSDPQQLLHTLQERTLAHPKVKTILQGKLVETAGHLGAFASRIAPAEGETIRVQHGVTIIATGGQEIRPAGDAAFGYGELPGVVTQREYERSLVEDDAERPASVVMIQCVGSRDETHPYCSRICCSEAIKNAIVTKQQAPQTAVSILYRDIRTYGFREDLYRQARELGVMFLEFDPDRPPAVAQGAQHLTVTLTVQPDQERVELPADRVVLSAGVEPSAGTRQMGDLLQIPLDEDGFIREANLKMRPVDLARDGIYVCGLAHSPRSLDETMVQARAAAMRAAVMLRKPQLEIQPNIAQVNPRLCSACGICVDVCPFGARVLPGDEGYYAHVIPELCQGCGVCVAACPNNACQQEGYQTRQMLSVIDSALVPA